MRHVIVGLFALAACGDNLNPAVDARPIDSAPADAAVDGPCAVGRYVTGEFLDVDSTTAALAGINNATFTQRGGTATDTTSPNGRFEMCASSTTSYVFDVDAPATHTDAIFYLEVEATGGWKPITLRTWTAARASSFYTSLGLTYDPAKAHVFIVQVADGAEMTLGGASAGAPQWGTDVAATGAVTWTPTNSMGGRYKLFPNVDPTTGTVTLDGDYSGQHTVPVVAGKITFVVTSTVYL